MSGGKGKKKQQPKQQPPPRKRQQPRPKRQAKVKAPMDNWLDVYSDQKPPSHISYGSATWQQKKTRVPLSTSTTDWMAIIVASNPGSNAQALSLGGGSNTVTVRLPVDEPSTSTKSGRLGVTLLHTSTSLYTEGSVYVLIRGTRVRPVSLGNAADQNQWCTEVAARDEAQLFAAESFRHRRRFNSYPVSDDYDVFFPNRGLESNNGFLEHVEELTTAEAGDSRGATAMTMAPIILLFPPTPNNVQTYMITIHDGMYYRFNSTSDMYRTMAPIPTAPLALCNTVRDKQESDTAAGKSLSDMTSNFFHVQQDLNTISRMVNRPAHGRGWFRKTGPVRALERAWDVHGPNVMASAAFHGGRYALENYGQQLALTAG